MSPKQLNLRVREFAGKNNLREIDTLDLMGTVDRSMDGKRLEYDEPIESNDPPSGDRRRVMEAWEHPDGASSEPERRRVRNGRPTNDLVFSACLGGNEDVFPQILGLYVAPGSLVADVTFGQGVFWRNVPAEQYRLLPSDIQNGIDCRELPYEDGAIDCVVLDPPYMHSPGGTAHTAHAAFERHYRNNETGNRTEKKYHGAVLALYEEAGKEAYRVLRERGVLIVKCQDEVCSNRQRFTHVEIMQMYERLGFIAEDLFIVVRRNRPGVSRVVRQVHARKNHSYFIVFWKRGMGRGLWERPE